MAHGASSHEVISQFEWPSGTARGGVTLRFEGEGRPLIVIPGLEGSGESCLHIVLPVVEALRAAGHPLQTVLVDYAQENHGSLEALAETVVTLVRAHAGSQAMVFWCQSFGNLIGALVQNRGGLTVERNVMVSSFIGLPRLSERIGPLVMRYTPAALYRRTIGQMGRYLFGPVGNNGNHPFFAALQAGHPRDAARRSAWIGQGQFDAVFEQLTAPLGVWLGARDRLVDLPEQSRFFQRLVRDRAASRFSMLRDSGHVILPESAIRQACDEIGDWLTQR